MTIYDVMSAIMVIAFSIMVLIPIYFLIIKKIWHILFSNNEDAHYDIEIYKLMNKSHAK